MRSKRSRMGCVLMAVAALLLLAGFACMLGVRDELQYVLPASSAAGTDGALAQSYRQAQRLLSRAGFDAAAIAARAQGRSIQRADLRGYAQATVYAVGDGYFDVRHRRLLEGRLIAPYDVAHTQQVMLMDSGAALELFQSESPVGQTVMLENKPFRVVGVVEGGRAVGETDEYRVYVPITAAEAIPLDTLEIAAGNAGGASAAIFENTLRAWREKGSFYHIQKLKMGAWLPLRWVLVLLALRLTAALGAGIVRFARHSAQAYRERLRHSYAGELLPGMIGRGLMGALLCAAFAALAFGAALAATQPVHLFGEWVPSVFVDWTSIQETFWNLNDLNAAGIRCVSREACAMELARGLIRWGTGCLVMGWACGRRMEGRVK